MKAVVLLSVLALSVSVAKAESLAVTSLAPSISTLCLDGGLRCRVVVEAANEAKAYLVDATTEIGPRLQRAMKAISEQDPNTQYSTQELAQIVWQTAQQYEAQAQ